MIESKLRELTNETLQLETESHLLAVLQKEKAWSKVDAQDKIAKSLSSATQLLRDQKLQEEQLLRSFGSKIEEAGSETVVGKVL